ncbi:hypothetical protein A8C76_29115 [Escherichia coli]|uniref:Uncharacterized protein n=1 Tax=Escherichia coli O6:H1 (strain CFT073 / ATCC 700928 / UPEC) TaxID=199310 RepID=A0A0H2VDR6_ECOL6|nr:Hypothetical protein c5212 [Escherichia coli CFT073]KEN88734.1 hypothetical protein AC84_5782 [Escherichia coli 1-392-07_S4_C1]OWD30170.1 hypothetical protein A8C76_29115 [Escherichia coli]OWF10685.1 hypothetical protein A8M78_27570 [Escherichia coli]GCL96030.1 hypothetical protein ExPCM15_02383 [Escherichia coli]
MVNELLIAPANLDVYQVHKDALAPLWQPLGVTHFLAHPLKEYIRARLDRLYLQEQGRHFQ